MLILSDSFTKTLAPMQYFITKKEAGKPASFFSSLNTFAMISQVMKEHPE